MNMTRTLSCRSLTGHATVWDSTWRFSKPALSRRFYFCGLSSPHAMRRWERLMNSWYLSALTRVCSCSSTESNNKQSGAIGFSSVCLVMCLMRARLGVSCRGYVKLALTEVSQFLEVKVTSSTLRARVSHLIAIEWRRHSPPDMLSLAQSLALRAARGSKQTIPSKRVIIQIHQPTNSIELCPAKSAARITRPPVVHLSSICLLL